MRGLTLLSVLGMLAACGHSADDMWQAQAKSLIAEHCGACHQVPGVAGARGRVGPSLYRVGEQQIIAGFFANTPAALTRWIEHPQEMLPGNAMPEMGLSHAEAGIIARYLYTQEHY